MLRKSKRREYVAVVKREKERERERERWWGIEGGKLCGLLD